MTRGQSASLLLLPLLCALAACGPGVSGRMEEGGSPDGRPTLTTVDTALADVDARSVLIQVRGSGFTASSTVFWRDAALETSFIAATLLVAELPLTDAVSWMVLFRDTVFPADVLSTELAEVELPEEALLLGGGIGAELTLEARCGAPPGAPCTCPGLPRRLKPSGSRR